MSAVKRIPVVREERREPTFATVLKRKSTAIADLPKDFGEAAMLIEAGYCAIVGRQLAQAAELRERTSPANREMTQNEDIAAQYFRAWEQEMRRRQIPADPVLSVLVDGMDPYEVDQRDHRPANWCAELVIEALGVFVRIRRDLTPVLLY